MPKISKTRERPAERHLSATAFKKSAAYCSSSEHFDVYRSSMTIAWKKQEKSTVIKNKPTLAHLLRHQFLHLLPCMIIRHFHVCSRSHGDIIMSKRSRWKVWCINAGCFMSSTNSLSYGVPTEYAHHWNTKHFTHASGCAPISWNKK